MREAMKTRILIIDDEEHIRRVTRLALEASGYEVGEAADGEKGIALFGDGSSWDAVLLDQKMPGMDGLETLRRIRGLDPSALVIMVTAFASIELAVDAMKLGATDFIRKPMTPEILRNAVSTALAKQANKILESAATTAGTIDTVTMNGFHVFMPPDFMQSINDVPGERRFFVRSPDGDEKVVVVEIGDAPVTYVERMIQRPLSRTSSFWTLHAQRTLTDYLWNEARIPPSGLLEMHSLDQDDVEMAARWDKKEE
jgi:CheY-like chemotaxis protein